MFDKATPIDSRETSSPDGEREHVARDPEAWLDLHGDRLFRFALTRVRNADLAEDLVQETLVKAVKSISNFRGEASVRTWLFTILRNEISGHFRKLSRERRAITSDESIELGELLHPEIQNHQFKSQLEKDEFWIAVNDCFEKIPEHLLETFLLRLADPDHSVEALCKEMGISASNFSVRLFRTRLLLRHCLEQTWLKELD